MQKSFAIILVAAITIATVAFVTFVLLLYQPGKLITDDAKSYYDEVENAAAVGIKKYNNLEVTGYDVVLAIKEYSTLCPIKVIVGTEETVYADPSELKAEGDTGYFSPSLKFLANEELDANGNTVMLRFRAIE